jgi:hypothetical protein
MSKSTTPQHETKSCIKLVDQAGIELPAKHFVYSIIDQNLPSSAIDDLAKRVNYLEHLHDKLSNCERTHDGAIPSNAESPLDEAVLDLELPPLYSIRSTFNGFGAEEYRYNGVQVLWVVNDRAKPVIPYSRAILGYDHMDDVCQYNDGAYLDQLFTGEEVEQFMAYLWKYHQTVIDVSRISIPFAPNYRNNGIYLFTDGVHITSHCIIHLCDEKPYNLPFKVMGFFDRHFPSKKNLGGKDIDGSEQVPF